MTRYALLALMLTAHALAAVVAPSGDGSSSLNGSGLTMPDVDALVRRRNGEEGDVGYDEGSDVLNYSNVVTDLGSTPDGGDVTSMCDTDAVTHDNVTSSGVGCQGNSRQSLETSRRYWLETIKSDLLSQLGRKSSTDVARTIPPIPEVQRWIDLVETGNEMDTHAWDGNDVDDSTAAPVSAKTMTVVAFPSAAPNISRLHSGCPVIYFRLNRTIVSPSSRLSRAHLGVFIRRTGLIAPTRKRSRRESTNIIVYRLESNSHQEPSLKLLWTRSIYLTWADTGRWYHFDALGVVEEWLADPETNNGLVITAVDSTKTQLAVLTAEDDYEERYLPYMEITVSDSPQRSGPGKRSLLVDDCDSTTTVDLSPSFYYTSANKRQHHCCRHPLIIDFPSLGWNWVIAPQRYNAYFCSGICPRFHYRSTSSSNSNPIHSHLLEQAGPAGYHGLCCAPASLSPLTIIYFDDQGRIKVRVVPAMVVTSCGCA